MGEATLFNRIKSHQDVGERWYPDILRRIKAEQAEAKAKAEEAAKPQLAKEEEDNHGVGVMEGAQAIRAH